MSRVEGYEDRGFLGDYAKEMPANVAGHLAQAIHDVAKGVYVTQATRDALAFQNALVAQADEIFQRNRNDPAGYSQDFDAMVSELSLAMGRKKNDRFASMAEGTKRQHMLRIAGDLAEENNNGNRGLVKNIMAQAINGVGIPISLINGGDPEVRKVGLAGLDNILERTLNCMAAKDGNGNILLSPQEITAFNDQFNGKIMTETVISLLSQCRREEDVDGLKNLIVNGKISVPAYGIGESADGLKYRHLGDRPLDIKDDSEWWQEMEKVIDGTRLNIMVEDVRGRQMPSLDDATSPGMLLGMTQPNVDEWFQRYRDSIAGAAPNDQENIIGVLARHVDRVPSAVVAVIRGAVASGDNDAIQVAAPYVGAWHRNNPAALARAFKDDERTLLRMFALANKMSTAATTQTGVRERTLKTFASTGTNEEERASYDRLVAEYASGDRLATLVNAWKNNQAGKPSIGNGDTVPRNADNDDYHPIFLAGLGDQFREYLADCGGDVDAATKMVQVEISSLGTSTLGKVRSPLMAHCPENFPGVRANRNIISQAMEKVGLSAFQKAQEEGFIPGDAEYGGTFLFSDDVSEHMVDDLDTNAKIGLDYIYDGEGRKTSCPDYLHVINYTFGGIVHGIPLGRFNPLLAINWGGGL